MFNEYSFAANFILSLYLCLAQRVMWFIFIFYINHIAKCMCNSLKCGFKHCLLEGQVGKWIQLFSRFVFGNWVICKVSQRDTSNHTNLVVVSSRIVIPPAIPTLLWPCIPTWIKDGSNCAIHETSWGLKSAWIIGSCGHMVHPSCLLPHML